MKEKTADGGLISSHTPTTNSFTVLTPASHTYVAGETLSINVTFPFATTVTGTPRLNLIIGATTMYANYISGSGSTTLNFQYLVVGTDNDSNGIALNSLELNAGAITFDNAGVATDCSVASVTARTFSNVKVDNTSSAISAFALSNLPGFYNKDESLNFSLTYDEVVYVTGTPRFSVDFGTGGPLYATYAGGTGSTVLSFTLLIDNTIADTNAYDSIVSSLDLNGGTIKDNVGNNASLDFSGWIAAVLTYSSTVNFNGQLPYVVSVTNPADGTYIAAQNLDFSVEFDRAVAVTGSPYLSVTIGSNVRQAVYQSGTGTDTILFRYTTVPGDVDTNGISVGTTITANSGTILGATAPAVSFFSVVANNSLSIPSTLAILIEAIQPQPTSVSRNTDTTNRIFPSVITDNTWIIAQEFLISVAFNTNIYVTQTGGTPRIPITIGASTQYATYLSGGNGQTTLIFRYVIQENDLDSDGTIALGDIDLNGGTITDISNTNSLLPIPTPTLTTTYIDGVKPTISSVGAAANGTYSTLTGNNHLIMTFTVTWAESVNYSTAVANVPLTIGVTAVNAAYASGNNTTTLIHRVSSLAGYTDTDGIAVASPMTGTAAIKDQAGNTATVLTFTPPTTTGILVDTTTPSISSVTTPADGTYVLGNDLNFTVNYNEVVNVISSGGYPRIALVMDSGTKYATYVSGSGTSNLLFRYTVVTNDSDLTGITNPTAISITNAPTAYIRDVGWNGNTTSSYAATIDLSGVMVDALSPSISSRTYPSNGTYDAADVLQFTLTYSEAVTVTGLPRIQVVAQTGTIDFNYTGGTGTTVLTFEYTVTANDFDFDGLPTSITTVDLNGGTINDTNSNAASGTFAAINLSAVYLAYPSTVVWTTNNFVNKSAIPGITLGSTGVVTNEACGTNTCRTFDGDDDLSISAGITGTETVFIVFKTPSTLGNLDLFATDISLTDDGSTLDLNTANASINLDGVTSSGINHNVNMSISTTHILQADFAAPQNYGVTSIVPTTYSGAIGEVIIINALLTNAQKTEILNYLNSKY